MLKLMDEKIFTFLRSKYLLIWTLYFQVINNPDLFPSNLKTDLPPYSQQPVVTPNTETGMVITNFEIIVCN